MSYYPNFGRAISDAKYMLKDAPIVKSSYWQGVNTQNRPEMATMEILNYSLRIESTNLSIDSLVSYIQPDLPWADDHFAERVCRKPLNPPPSEAWWPHAPKGNDQFKNQSGLFSHTYPERYWPLFAGNHGPNQGIRFPYGDVDDLIILLLRDPYSRQAYLPVWFPEDLGAPIDQRKPCTLGYHFIMRDDLLHVVYYIRSCDFVRHFKNDIYFTVRLQHWLLDELKSKDSTWDRVIPGSFTMHITSLHLFVNDYHQLFDKEVS
jgi:thymidylate synthase-like protein